MDGLLLELNAFYSVNREIGVKRRIRIAKKAIGGRFEDFEYVVKTK